MKLTGTFKTNHARQLAKEVTPNKKGIVTNIGYDKYLLMYNTINILEKAEQFFDQRLTPEMFWCDV